MAPIVIIAFIIFAVFLYFVQNISHDSRIEEKIRSIGGEVVQVERRNFFTGLGPFMVVGKGRSVYRIEYTVNVNTKEGWVRFGGLMGPDWRL